MSDSRRPSRAALVRTGAVAALLGLSVVGCAAPSSDATGAVARVLTTGGSSDFHGTVLDRPYALPDVTFTTSQGGTLDPAEHRVAPVTLVFFGYTHCPDVCNAVLADVAAALRRADASVRSRTALLFVTTDPARDTPAVMRDYLARFDPSFVGLTADLATIEKAAAALHVALTGTTALPDGGYDVGHGAQLIGFGPQGEGRIVWMPGTPVGDLRADLTRLAAT
jgi:protein SCO1/2